MKLLHKLKTGKINDYQLTEVRASTRHVVSKGEVRHEGWAIGGKFADKSHEYYLMFTPEEAREHHKWLGEMLHRFDTDDIDSFITEEET